MLTAKSARWAAIVAGLAVALSVLFYPTDEKRVREAADAIVAAANANPAELSRALDTYASPNVSVDAAELAEPLRGRESIVAAAARVSALGKKLRFHVEGVEISIDGKRARLSADLITTLRAEVPELRRPRRSVALFEKKAGGFLLISAEIGAEQLDQPEARP